MESSVFYVTGRTSKLTLTILFYLLLYLVANDNIAQSSDTSVLNSQFYSANDPKPIVYLIGSMHRMHFQPEFHYTINDLINQIISLKPDLVCGEITNEAFNNAPEGYFPPEAAWLAEMAPDLNYRFEAVDWRIDYATQLAAEKLYPQTIREQCNLFSNQLKERMNSSIHESIYDYIHSPAYISFTDSLYEQIIGVNQIAETAHGQWHERNRRIIENGLNHAGDAKIIVFVFGIDHIPGLIRQLKAVGIDAIIPERSFKPGNNFIAPEIVVKRWQRNLLNLQQIESGVIKTSEDYFQKVSNSKRIENLQEAISKSTISK